MGLMDRIKKVTGTNDNYDDSYDDDYYGGFEAYDDVEDDGDVQMALLPFFSIFLYQSSNLIRRLALLQPQKNRSIHRVN